MRIAQEEVFGPVLSVIPFEDEDDAVKTGNDVITGLRRVWTQNIGRAITMAEKLRAGTVWVNTYRAVSYLSLAATRNPGSDARAARNDQGILAAQIRLDRDIKRGGAEPLRVKVSR